MPQELGARMSWRQLVFRPWRWNRWVWIGLLVLSPVIYFLSAIPVVYVVEDFLTPKWDDTVMRAMDYAYFPVWMSVEMSPALEAVLVWEMDIMEDFLIWLHKRPEPAEGDPWASVLPFRHVPHQADLADPVWGESPAA